MFNRKNNQNETLSSNAMVFRKYKIIEISLMVSIVISGILASIFLGLESSNPVGAINNLYRILIGCFAGILIILLVCFIIFYFKIKKLIKERDENDN